MSWFIFFVFYTSEGNYKERYFDQTPETTLVKCNQNILKPKLQKIVKDAKRLNSIIDIKLVCMGIPTQSA